MSETEVVKLEQNYRSTEIILSAANAVIKNNQGRMGKRPLGLKQKEGEQIFYFTPPITKDDEARYVVGSIQTWMGQGKKS